MNIQPPWESPFSTLYNILSALFADYYLLTQLRQSLHQKRTRERRDSTSLGKKEPFSGKNLILQVGLA